MTAMPIFDQPDGPRTLQTGLPVDVLCCDSRDTPYSAGLYTCITVDSVSG